LEQNFKNLQVLDLKLLTGFLGGGGLHGTMVSALDLDLPA
jgi:hypothetical protein